ncbi:MAG: amino acid adenylation domain-containing protein [Candidatus Omnitrophota bacterium]
MKLGEFSLFQEKDKGGDLLDLVKKFNRNRTDYPKNQTVHAIFSKQAAKTPGAVAVIHGDESLTYRELDERSNRLARFLLTQRLESESLVGVMLDRSLEMAVALVGILKAGCAYLPINYDLPFPRIQYMLNDACVRVLLSEKRYIRTLNKLQWECPKLQAIFCLDSRDIYAEPEETGEMMKEEMWEFIRRDVFDDISGGGWRSSYTGEWLSREVMDEYGDNIRQKMAPYLNQRSRVLEIGCASGISLFRLAPLAGFYCGTELSRDILHWTEREIQKRGWKNIRLAPLAAHEIDRLEEKNFDAVIFNSVIQCFSGYNYLRDALRKAIALMNDEGRIFLGNLWDEDLKADFVRSLQQFAREHASERYSTKIDRSEELFLSRTFLQDLRHDFPEIAAIEFSQMLGQAKSELSEYGYDAILTIDKKNTKTHPPLPPRSKHQFDLRALDNLSADPVEERGCGNHLAYLIYTSGTTGLPKGAMIEHRSILRLVLNTNYIDLGESDRILQTGALAFDASTFEIWEALLNGGAVCFLEEEDLLNAVELGHLIQKHKITTIFLTTSLFNMLVSENVEIFQDLKTLLTGGEKASVHHFNKIRKAFPSLTLKHVYGPTENTTFTTFFNVEKCYERDVPIGAPIANSSVYILNENLQPVPIGVPGELCTGGDGLARGYWNDPALTARKFIPHPFATGERLYRTGDFARWLPDGAVEFLERMDDQVKVRGYRIEPGDIAACILHFNGVKEAFVLAKNLGDESNELIAYATGDKLDVNSLREFLKGELPDYMIPAHLIPLDKLPLNASGKVDRRALPEPARQPLTKSQSYAPPQSETEKQLAAIWEEALDRQGIGVLDDFFDSGGHSLKVAKVVSLIEKRMKVVIPFTVIFKAPTIRELALRILDCAKFGWEGIDEAMVLLSGKTDGPNLFAFPPGTGDAASYIQAAESLKPCCFYGFNFIEAASRIKDYADLVMSVDPEGPYLFLGYSSGGNLAFHAAKEIENRGKRVSDIIMIDSGRKTERFHFDDEEVQKVADEFLNHESNRPYLTNSVLREKAERMIRHSYACFENLIDDFIVDANIHVILCDNSTDEYRDERGRLISNKKGWSEAARGEFKTYQGAGDHNHMLYKPYLEKNAKLIREIIDKTLTANRLAKKPHAKFNYSSPKLGVGSGGGCVKSNKINPPLTPPKLGGRI